jgi:hypothetical protein
MIIKKGIFQLLKYLKPGYEPLNFEYKENEVPVSTDSFLIVDTKTLNFKGF